MLTLLRVGGSKEIQNAYGCLRCYGWVGLKNLNTYGCVLDGGSEIFKRVLMFIQPKSEIPIFENWGKTPQKNTFLTTIDLVGVVIIKKLGI